MRVNLALILIVLLVQPAYAQSWFSKIFGRSDQASSVFTEDERKIITEYFINKATRKTTASKNEDEEDYHYGYHRDGKRDEDHDDDAGKGGTHGKGKNKYKKSGKKSGLPPGLAKKENLPPGLARQIEKNGTLPPGLSKRDLPTDLESALPRRKGAERVIVDDDVVLIEKTTGKVLDILKDVLRNR